MNTLLLLAALVALAICVVGLVFLLRRYTTTLAQQRRDAAAQAAGRAEAQASDEAATAALPATGPSRWSDQLAERPALRNGLLVALVVLLGIGALLAYNTATARTPERYVVLVAPFDDGGDGQAGRSVANELANQIRTQSGGRISTAVANTRPETPQVALELATAAHADVLIWGAVAPGALLDSPSLSPRLIYLPSGPYGPNGWDGYVGRFAMPRSYTVAREPINGQAVLVPLVLALHDYASGAPDLAYEQLGGLLANYPSLNAPLPHALRGNVLWARTLYSDAAASYRLALAEPSDEQALLANNLGAILLDAGDPGVFSAFQETVRLLAGRDLGELRYNLATLALRESRPTDAVVELEQARNLMPPQVPLLLDLARAYRDVGRLPDAATTLEAARRQAPVDLRAAPSPYRTMLRTRTEAALGEQQALLGLARGVGAQGALLWELEVAAPQPVRLLSDLRRQLDSAADSSAREVSDWRKRATSDGATRPGSGLVATGQSGRAEANADRQRFYLAVVETELARVQGDQPRSVIGGLFGGGAARTGQLPLLEELQRRYPDNAQISNALGRAQRLSGALDSADLTYDATIRLAPQAPEGYFGRGAVARARGDSPRAAELYNVALERNGGFFPSRYELAVMAEEQGDYAAAVVQRRLLYAQRSGTKSAVALAQDLRQSGASGFAEAEQVLIPLSTSSAEAAIELARLYNDAGRTDAAIQAYQDALRLDADSSVAAFELGESYVVQGSYPEAERALQQAVRADPANVAARLALADLYQGPLENPQRAEGEYRQALDQGVNDPLKLEQIGDAARAAGNYGQAIDAYSDAIQVDPNNPLYHHKLGQAYFAADRLQLAAEQENLVLALASDPNLRAEALTTLGDVARLSGDLPGATGSYTQALQLNPGLIAAQLGLGLVAVGQGNWGVASGYFQTAAAMPGGGESALAQFWLGEALLRQGDAFGATAAYNRALALQPSFPEANLGLAQVRYAQGDTQKALETVEIAVAQKADYAEALLFQGKLLQELGRTSEAETAYSASIRWNNQIAEAHYRRGILALQASRYDDAVRDLRQATQLQPNFPEAFYWLGRAYYAEGRLDQALQALQQAVALNGNFTEAIFYVGLVSEDLGRTAEAVSAFQTVIALDPSSTMADEARANIDRLT